MTSLFRIGAVLVFVALGAVSCVDPVTCSARTCPTGCCNTSGACEPGTNVGACGTGAVACLRCGSGQACTDRQCKLTGAGGGAGGGAAGGSAGGMSCGPTNCQGCCRGDGSCVRPPDNMLDVTCGVGGDVCFNCALRSERCMAIGFCTVTDAGTGGSGGGAGGAGGGSAGGAGGGQALGAITGHSIATTRFQNGTTTTAPFDLTGTVLQALVLNPDGGYDVLAGSGTAAGQFSVPNVPNRTYLLRVGSQYFETAERVVNLDFEQFGRDGAPATIDPTTLSVSATGLEPWDALKDEVHVFIPNQGLDLRGAEYFFASPLVASATSFNTTLNYYTVGYPLINTTDTVYFAQERTTTVEDVQTTKIVAAGQVAPFMMRDGQTSTIVAPHAAIQTVTQTISWNLNAFSLLKADLPPLGTEAGGDFAVAAYPSPIVQSLSLSTGTLASVYVPEAAAVPTSITFASPFPSTYSLGARVGFSQLNLRRLPTTSAGGEFFSGVFSDGPLLSFTAPNMIAPTISAVRSPTIQGQGFYSATLPVNTTTPTIAWIAPGMGTASRYYVVINRLAVQGPYTVVDQTRAFWVGVTSLVVPPGVMASGQLYVIQIGAVSVPAATRLDRDVFSRPVPYHESYVTSVIIRL